MEGLGKGLSHRIVICVQGTLGDDNVELLADRLAPAAYAEAWATCYAALLLHDPTVYRLRGSGTVCDAVAGRPFVCLEGASLAERAVDGNARASCADPSALVEAVGRLVEHCDAFFARKRSPANG